MRSSKWLLALGLLAMSSVTPAAIINITVPANTVALQTNTGVVLTSGTNPYTLSAGTYTVWPDRSSGSSCGQFTVDGSGNVSVLGGAPGMSATGADNNLTFNVASFTIARGTYSGSYYWEWVSAANYTDVTRNLPRARPTCRSGGRTYKAAICSR